jgi:RNA polymerase sigma-70 factor, ECF subfamily
MSLHSEFATLLPSGPLRCARHGASFLEPAEPLFFVISQHNSYHSSSYRWFVVSVASSEDQKNPELVVRLLMKHQEDLFRYIYSLLPHEEDARDVLQETSVSLYRKFADYDPSKPFLAWAYAFAHLEVLKQRDRNFRGTRHLRQELVEVLAREREAEDPLLHSRLQALDLCLKDLPAPDQKLISQRYQGGCQIDELVTQLGTSRRTLFRNLDRIRRLLFECINRRLHAT